MPHDETLAAGAALHCGALVLVPVVRVAARSFAGVAHHAEAEIVGFVACAGDMTAHFLATTADPPPDAASWSDWLDDRPALLAAIRERLAGVR